MEHYISQYIDNELSLDEKIYFLERFHKDPSFRNETFSLLSLEKIIRVELQSAEQETLSYPVKKRTWTRSLGYALAASIVISFSFLFGNQLITQHETAVHTAPGAVTNYRFIIHQEETAQVEIVGSFTNWTRVPLASDGSNGYWEITLPVEQGEHRYSFIINGTSLIPDPTIAAQEPDDFGTINSIIDV